MTQKTLNALLERQAELDERIKRLIAKSKKQQLKDENHMKFLVGAYQIKKAKTEGTWTELVNGLDSFLIRSKERALFGLPDKDNVTESKSG